MGILRHLFHHFRRSGVKSDGCVACCQWLPCADMRARECHVSLVAGAGRTRRFARENHFPTNSRKHFPSQHLGRFLAALSSAFAMTSSIRPREARWARKCMVSDTSMKLLIATIALALFPWPSPTYLDATCSQFVCRRANRPELKAQELWDGGDGQLRVVQAQARFEDVITEDLLEGDVIAFHGVHVAVYTHGDFMDSTPEHGPGRMQYRAGDQWYAGPVRVLRWKK